MVKTCTHTLNKHVYIEYLVYQYCQIFQLSFNHYSVYNGVYMCLT